MQTNRVIFQRRINIEISKPICTNSSKAQKFPGERIPFNSNEKIFLRIRHRFEIFFIKLIPFTIKSRTNLFRKIDTITFYARSASLKTLDAFVQDSRSLNCKTFEYANFTVNSNVSGGERMKKWIEGELSPGWIARPINYPPFECRNEVLRAKGGLKDRLNSTRNI